MQTWQNKDGAERTGRLFNLLCFYFAQVRTPPQAADGVVECVYESFVPGENLTRGSRRNQLRRGHGSPPVLSEVPHELSIPMRTPKSANGPRSNSFRPDSPLTTTSPRGRKTQLVPPPHRTWSVPDASSQPQLNLSNSVLSELLHFA